MKRLVALTIMALALCGCMDLGPFIAFPTPLYDSVSKVDYPILEGYWVHEKDDVFMVFRFEDGQYDIRLQAEEEGMRAPMEFKGVLFSIGDRLALDMLFDFTSLLDGKKWDFRMLFVSPMHQLFLVDIEEDDKGQRLILSLGCDTKDILEYIDAHPWEADYDKNESMVLVRPRHDSRRAFLEHLIRLDVFDEFLELRRVSIERYQELRAEIKDAEKLD